MIKVVVEPAMTGITRHHVQLQHCLTLVLYQYSVFRLGDLDHVANPMWLPAAHQALAIMAQPSTTADKRDYDTTRQMMPQI